MNQSIAALAAILLLSGCNRESVAPVTHDVTEAPSASQAGYGPAIDRDLALLRRVTAPAHDTLAAAGAGWSVPITGCMAAPGAGAMGYHYGNVDYIEDGVLRVDQPELLLYEPTREGGRRLVGVEYVILYRDWPREAAPPVLLGQDFVRVDGFGLWGLHAWVWAANPEGIFTPWNPRVSCAFAPAARAASAAAHH